MSELSDVEGMTQTAHSRRRVLGGGAAALAATVATQTIGAGPASAAYTPYPYTKTLCPTVTARHYMNRLGCGFSPSTYSQLSKIGGSGPWFRQQLTPEVVVEDAKANSLAAWFPDLDQPAATKWKTHTSGVKQGWSYAEDLANLTLMRRIYSRRQVFENMVDFWSNQLHVHASADNAWVQRASYDTLIRQHALGRFDEMLVAAALHPAMLLYLDNWKSTKLAPNENQGRELLELHTVGRASGYTEAMVKDSAKILSGFTVDAGNTWDGFYDPAKHATGAVQVLGFTSANASADGQQVARDYLTYLARHPATAQNIARKLALRFVSDNPSTSLVTAVAKAFRDSGTDIKTTLKALVAHPDFLASKDRLVRNPDEDLVATCRALRLNITAPTVKNSFARAAIHIPQSTRLYQWPRPDGAPYGAAAWASPNRMLTSFRMHWDLALGSWPTLDVTHQTEVSWLPEPQMRYDQFVDHLCRKLLGRPSDARLLSVAVAAIGYAPSTIVSSTHRLFEDWRFGRLLGALLDSPEHLSR